MQMTPHGLHQLRPVCRMARAQPVGFDVLVQEFIRIEFWTVARQADEPYSPGVPGHEPRDISGSMNGMPIHDEIDPAADRLQQPRQKLHKDGGTKASLKDHEGQRPLVRNS